jgi:hypothetical protein
VLAVFSSAAIATDPLTLILLRLLRDQIISSSIEAAIESNTESASQKLKPLLFPQAPYDLGDEKLRALIDEGFVHLTAAQREEVFVSLKRALADPKNASARPVIIHELALKASALRQAHEHLNNLSFGDKRNIVVQAREEYVKLPEEERLQMLQVLQSGIAPIPRDLNDMILAEFRAAQPAAAVSAPAEAATTPQ